MPDKVKVSDDTWDKLRMEYISSSEASIRGIAKKYGIPYNAVRNRCQKEDWLGQRETMRQQMFQKSIALVSDTQAEECSRAFRLANKVMDKLEEVIDKIEAEDSDATRYLKNITSAIKDLKEIGLFRSELDKAEQMARISKLRKDAEEERPDATITVKFTENNYGN